MLLRFSIRIMTLLEESKEKITSNIIKYLCKDFINVS